MSALCLVSCLLPLATAAVSLQVRAGVPASSLVPRLKGALNPAIEDDNTRIDGRGAIKAHVAIPLAHSPR